jgi:mono/diheme cytochrome c family protein
MIKALCRLRLLTPFLIAGLLMAGCGHAPQKDRTDPLMDVFRKEAQEEGLSRQQTLGKQLFGHYCVTCHGEQGEGDGQNAYNLNPSPPNFKESLKQHPPSYWRNIIEGGTAALGRSPLCPPWGRELNTRQIDAIVDYLKALSEPVGQKPANPDASQPK